MMMHLDLPSPEPLNLSGGNISTEIIQTEIHKLRNCDWNKLEDSATRVATLLTVIGNDAIDVFNTLTRDEEGNNKKIVTVEICKTL